MPQARSPGEADPAADGPGPRPPALRKRLAHLLKTRLFELEPVDAWLDRRLERPAGALGRALRERFYLRLFPERRVAADPFGERPPGVARIGTAAVLSLVPPEDAGGTGRPAALAVELHRRGYDIEWRYALASYPWPRLRRAARAGVRVERAPGRAFPPDLRLVLVEAPHPDLAAALDAIGNGCKLVYDAIDAWDTSLGSSWFRPAVERALLRRATHLVASSRVLRDRLVSLAGRDVLYLPNACDASRFGRGAAPPGALSLRRGLPTVVFVGALWGAWVDLALIEGLARALPSAEIHLIGPSHGRRLPSAPNLHAHGPRPHGEIPAILAQADVAIVPFTTDRLAAAVSPLKVFEYLAAGRPVVSTPLPEIEGLPGVRIARGVDAFARAIDEAVGGPFPRAEVSSLVRASTWEARVDALLRWIGEADARSAAEAEGFRADRAPR